MRIMLCYTCSMSLITQFKHKLYIASGSASPMKNCECESAVGGTAAGASISYTYLRLMLNITIRGIITTPCLTMAC